MINKNYDQCFHCECTARVKEVIEEKDFYWHYLDNTIFFVESGGMRSDIGTINNLPVLGLKVENNKVWHLLDQKLEGTVFLSVNLHERFRKAQVHTAQHLISALIGGIYGAKTISHHTSDDENDVEFEMTSFTQRQCSELQILTNGLIRDDLPVTISYPNKAEAMKYAPKSACEHDEIRVVKIGNLDYNLCGCIHVPSLKYIQMIKILGFEKTTRGIKIKYVCGDQFLDAFEKRYDVLEEVSHALALPHLYVMSGINKLTNDKKKLTEQLVEMKNNYYTYLAKEIATTNKKNTVIHEFADFDAKDLSQFTLAFVNNYDRVAIFITRTDSENMHMTVAHSPNIAFNSQVFFKLLADKFGLHGGGNASLAQGGGKYNPEIIEFLKNSPIF